MRNIRVADPRDRISAQAPIPAPAAGRSRGQRVRDILLTIPVALLLPAIVLLSAPAAAAGPTMAANPTTLAAGTKVVVRATDFAAGSRGVIVLDDAATAHGEYRAHRQGRGRGTVVVPAPEGVERLEGDVTAVPGDHREEAVARHLPAVASPPRVLFPPTAAPLAAVPPVALPPVALPPVVLPST